MPSPPDVDKLRVRLAAAGDYLHNLYRVHNNSEADLTEDVKVWEKIVDERAGELVAAAALATALKVLDQKR